MRKVTRNDINKENMVKLSYCQCQRVLNLFGGDYKIGYNIGNCGWNYDVYRINGVDIVTGYSVPNPQHENKEVKKQLISLEDKLSNYNFGDYEILKKEFLKIFE